MKAKEILRVTREKNQDTISLTSKFSPATMGTSKPWSSIFKVLRESDFKSSLSFKNKGKIDF